ncbi:MAG: hypothetical protein ABJA02_10950 [Acidobacteriota bacterium]
MKSVIKSKYFCLFAAIACVMFTAAVGMSQTTPQKSDKHEMSMDKCPADCPMMNKDGAKQDHHADVMKNGEKAMGFSQTATTHHFLQLADGGAIQVEANDPKDTANRDAVRGHLAMITKQFGEGIFTTPFAVHGTVPDGVPEMDKLKADIKYTYEETANGARVHISTANPEALAAIHSFIRFQINEHKTGDPLTLDK